MFETPNYHLYMIIFGATLAQDLHLREGYTNRANAHRYVLYCTVETRLRTEPARELAALPCITHLMYI